MTKPTCPRDSPSTVDSSEAGHAVGQDVEGKVPSLDQLYYSSHIAAVCESVNADAKGTLQNTDIAKAEKRRETNRLSARRSRKRRRDEIEHLEEELRRLAAETEELTSEQRRLQQELQEERSKDVVTSTPPVRQATLDTLGLTGRAQYDASSQALLQQQLHALLASGNSRSSYQPPAQTQRISFSQASLVPNMFQGMNSQMGAPSAEWLSLAGLIGQNSMDRNMLALLQNNALMQVGHQATAAAPLSMPVGVLSNAMNNMPCSTQHQTRDETTLQLIQALSGISSLSSTANIGQRFAQSQQVASQLDAATGSAQVGSQGGALEYAQAWKGHDARNLDTSDNTDSKTEDTTSYEV